MASKIYKKINWLQKPVMKIGLHMVQDADVKYDIPGTKSSGDAFKLLLPFFEDCLLHHERFVVLFMNRRNIPACVMMAGEGTTSSTVVDVKGILQGALLCNACTAIISHNHPSENNAPSHQDDAITNKIKSALELIDVKVLDHIIVCGRNNYFSYADEGKL